MTWSFTDSAAAFRAAAAEHLAADAARNTAVLTLMDKAGRLGWWAEADGRVTGVLAEAPPGVPSLGVMTEEAARALTFPPGEEPTEVRGETAAVEAYAEATGRPWATTARMRLFRLGELTPPDPAPAGRERVATEADVPLVAAWTREFAVAIGDEPAEDYTGFVTERISEGRLWLWEAPDGRPVSMAAVSRTIEGQARVHLVYTPPAERGRGYAAGATEAVSRAAREAGVAQVLLFTDLANPTSNALYQRLGYRPVTDHLGVTFTR
ncbi:GNAT family N-acetyltransferase [Streptomyces vietnamensis]|uniref:Acetyltransferase n=1 Tax=Streptomyces vietnamensis TaxID=362257 RepID=A0A0B5I5I6_9ACTN|nr:GNAT family N-acetyltransferase [Streptomyces vietnamensis]AJF64913.1 acetyltransferase [Streptomyces vietnamensis]